jgi:quercetin dioxygenase-like cupin family protein
MSVKERKDPKERALNAPLLSFVLAEQIEQLQKESQWLSGDRNSITLIKNPRLRLVLVALRKGAIMREHQVEGPITLFVLTGAIHFTAGGEKQHLQRQNLLALEKAIPHDVEALEDSIFLLTIVLP